MATFKGKVRVEGLNEAKRAFRRLPKDGKDALRDGTLKLSETLARSAESAARAHSPQAALMAPLIKAYKGQVPQIGGGGSRRVGRNRVPAWKILFGAEFGSNRLPQFRPHRGQKGYWLFPTVEREKAAIAKAWIEIGNDVAKRFGED